jgi:hypothetical protein
MTNTQDNNENKFWFKFKKVGGFVLSGFGLLFGEGTLENLKL